MASRIPDEDVIRRMLDGASQRQISAETGLTVRALQIRARKPAFQAALRKAQTESLEAAVTALQGRLTAAVEVLTECMQNKEAAAQVRVNAACALIDRAAKLTEITDILPRLAELERVAAKQSGGYRG